MKTKFIDKGKRWDVYAECKLNISGTKIIVRCGKVIWARSENEWNYKKAWGVISMDRKTLRDIVNFLDKVNKEANKE